MGFATLGLGPFSAFGFGIPGRPASPLVARWYNYNRDMAHTASVQIVGVPSGMPRTLEDQTC